MDWRLVNGDWFFTPWNDLKAWVEGHLENFIPAEEFVQKTIDLGLDPEVAWEQYGQRLR